MKPIETSVTQFSHIVLQATSVCLKGKCATGRQDEERNGEKIEFYRERKERELNIY